MRSCLARHFLLAVLAVGPVAATHAATHAAGGPTLPWADPIGVSPTYGTARPSLPYAEPIGASQLNAPRRPLLTLVPRPHGQIGHPTRSCYRFRDNRGFAGTRCVVR